MPEEDTKKSFKRSSVLAGSILYAAFAANANATPLSAPNVQNGAADPGHTTSLKLKISQTNAGSLSFQPNNELTSVFSITPTLSSEVTIDAGRQIAAGENRSTSGIKSAKLVFNSAAGNNEACNYWELSVGLLGDERILKGALQDWYGGFSPIWAGQLFHRERIRDFTGLKLAKNTRLTQKWSWNQSIAFGRKVDQPEQLKPIDAFNFLFEHNINTAPALREALHDAWEDGQHDDLLAFLSLSDPISDEDVHALIDAIPDYKLNKSLEQLINDLKPFLPLVRENITGEEFAGVVAGSLSYLDEIDAQVLDRFFEVLRSGHGNGDTLISRSEFSRITDTGHISFGAESSLVKPANIGSAEEVSLGLFIKAGKKLTDNIDWKMAGQIAVFKNYLNLEDVDNAMGTVYTSVEWDVERVQGLKLHAGIGASRDALFGEVTEKEIGAHYTFIENAQMAFTGYAAIGEVESDEGYYRMDRSQANQMGLALNYRI